MIAKVNRGTETKRPDTGQLKARASRGAVLLWGNSLTVNGLNFLRLVIVARLLLPVDFGIYALSLVLYQGLMTFTDMGLRRYLLQKDDLDTDLVRSAWMIGILRGMLIGALIWACAPLYARALGQPLVGSVLAIVGLAAVIEGARNPGRVLAEREVLFGRIVASRIIKVVLEAVIVVALAYWIRDPRALAWGLVAATAIGVALSFLLFPRVGSPRFDLRDFRELFAVGRFLWVTSVTSFITARLDNFLAGILFGTATVGIYVVAYRLAVLPGQLVFTVTNKVALPTLSRLQSDRRRLEKTFEGLVDLQLCVLVPLVALLVVFARPLVGVIYGEKWLEAVPVLQAMALLMISRGISSAAAPFVIATGNFAASARAQVMQLAVFFPAIWLGAHFLGIEGFAVGVGVASFTAAWFLVVSIRSLEGLRVGWLRRVLVALLCATPSIACGLWVQSRFNGSPIAELILIVTTFGAAYVAVIALFRRRLLRQLRGLATAALPRRAPATSLP